MLLPRFLVLALVPGCATSRGGEVPPPAPVPGRFALAIQGGAGTLDRDAPPERLAAYRAALRAALTLGRDRLARGDAALDVCEAVVRQLEDDPLFNAGKGAAFNEKGEHELDAAIMDGSTLRCGAVAGVRSVKNPVSLARKVMERTSHVLLMGDGAEEFADAMGVERVPNSHFDTEHRRRMLEEALRERRQRGAHLDAREPRQRTYGTVGCVACDQRGNLAAATSTGGLTAKKFGRVGDSPIVGAGNYADRYAAVSGTGTGEEFIRHAVARTVAARMQFGGETLAQAAVAVVLRTMRAGDGGVIAVDRAGNLAAVYNSEGMYRGLADSAGRFEVAIFED
jgi:beta-aspartyl-peptidase (threonine type)